MNSVTHWNDCSQTPDDRSFTEFNLLALLPITFLSQISNTPLITAWPSCLKRLKSLLIRTIRTQLLIVSLRTH